MDIEKQKQVQEIDEQLDTLIDKWNKAVFHESEVREFAFTNAYVHILGFKCKQLTLRHYQTLDFLNSIFIKKATDDTTPDIMIKHIIDFLWVVSSDYKDYDIDAGNRFAERVKASISEHGINKFIAEIIDYLNKSLMDAPKQVEEEPKLESATTAYCASFIDLLASEYHWTDEHILDLPFARIMQYSRCIEERMARDAGSQVKLTNPFTSKIETEIIILDDARRKLLEGESNG